LSHYAWAPIADAAKTRAIPPSLLTVYDLRQPINRLVIELIEKCPVFRGKIDSTSKSLGKNSLCLFLTNQIRQLCRAMLVGDVAMAEGPFLEKAKQLLPGESEYQSVLAKFVSYINILTEHLPAWKEAANILPGPDLNRIKILRAKPTLAWSATGLNIIGRLAYDLFTDPTIKDWRPYAEQIGKLNFNKSNPLWKDVLTLKKNKSGIDVWHISTQRGPVMRAVGMARQEIGLDQEPERETAGNGFVSITTEGKDEI
jgi:DNA sulfur modification protein DndB